MLAGTWEPVDMSRRMREVIGADKRLLERLAKRMLKLYPTPEGLSPSRLAGAIARDAGFRRKSSFRGTKIGRRFLVPDCMAASRVPLTMALPQLPTTGDLAGWLGLTHNQLDGHADLRGLHLSRPEFDDYRRWRQGTRWIEAPKDRLRGVQRKILREILEAVPVHDAAHGFCKGRGPRSHAALHVGKHQVMRLDLRRFFPSIPRKRVRTIFGLVGYPARVSRVLAALCTTISPVPGLYRQPHLPQGAPSSPRLANLVCFSLDVRLTALGNSWNATYTRYADDLTFSGDRLPRISVVDNIVREEGFKLNKAKTRVMGQGTRQMVTGVVVNRHPAVPRAARKELEAVLVNCIRQGWRSQNRKEHADFRAHLRGRIAQVHGVRPDHGTRLLTLYNQVEW